MRVLLYSAISGFATIGGGLIAILLKRKQSKSHISLMLGLAAGVMSAVVLFDLLPEAIEYTTPLGVIIGFAIGISVMLCLELIVPHLHKHQKFCNANDYVKMGLFVALGIALHNLPEGLAIGAGYEAAPDLGAVIAIAIALHNIPEGLGLAVPLSAGGMKASSILFICLLAGIFTPIGTLIGMMFLSINENFIGIALALAAGAMSYIVVEELVPEAWQQARLCSGIGVVCGLVLAFIAH